MDGAPAYTVEEVIEQYLNIRGELETLKKEYEAKKALCEQRQQIMEAWLSKKLDADGLDSFKTGCGTAFFKTANFCNVADWDLAREFIVSQQAWHLLNKAVSKTAVTEYVNENGTPPPGINFVTKREVSVRRA